MEAREREKGRKEGGGGEGTSALAAIWRQREEKQEAARKLERTRA